MLRKTLIGLTVVAAALVANPFNHADAAPGDARQCVNQGRAARNQAQNTFQQAVRGARNLEPGARQAAVLAGVQAFRDSAQTANTNFVACIRAIDTGQ